MKLATKHILKAIKIEIILAIVTYFLIGILTGGIGDFLTLFIVSMVSISPCIGIAYFIGEKINYPKIDVGIRFFFGIIVLFVLLTISFSLGGLIFSLIYESKLLSFSDWLNIVVIFYIFGGFQTLCVGIWLGYKLSCIKN